MTLRLQKPSSIAQLSQYLILALLLALPLERIPELHLNDFGSNINIRISQVLGLILILINIPHLWSRRDALLKAPWRWLAIFVFVTCIAAGLALSQSRGLLVAFYIGFVALLSWVIAERVELSALGRYRNALLLSAVLACLFGLFQYFGNLAGLSGHTTGLLPRYTKAVFGFPRIQSTGYEPLYFADYLLGPIALASSYFLWRRRAYWPIIILFITTFALTLSRGAYVGLAAVIVLLLFFAMKDRLYNGAIKFIAILMIGALIALALIALSPALSYPKPSKPVAKSASQAISAFTSQSVDTTSGNSVVDRSTTWKTAFSAFKEHPLFGVGPGNFGIYAHETNPSYFYDNNSITNNEPLEILSEEGGIGILVFILFIIDLLLWLRKNQPNLPDARLWRNALLIALVGMAVQYQTFSTLYITNLWVIIGLLIGIAAVSPEPV